jgi:type IV secretion system T-DNA border endonuclease VirD2
MPCAAIRATGLCLIDGARLVSLESALWEATRPAFRVRYIHDPASMPRVPLYASYGFATGPTARAKLARIVRKAPEVVVKVTGRQRGGNHVKAHLDYIGRKGKLGIETRDGEVLISKDDIAERAAEWSDTLQWRSRPTVSSVSLIFSMPAGNDPEKVLEAVRALAHAELSDNHDYGMALHTDTPRPHVHLTVQAEGLDRTRFNPGPVQLNRFRERFARELRARGVAAEATPRRARGQGIAGSSMALIKLRARLRGEGSRQITKSDRRTNEQAISVARGQDQLPLFIAAGSFRWREIRRAYEQAAVALDATGQSDDRALASDVRAFLEKRQSMNSTPQVFAHQYARQLGAEQNRAALPVDIKPPDHWQSGRGRSR